MKLKTMDTQKFLLTGWYPKMAHNTKIDESLHRKKTTKRTKKKTT